MSGYLAIHRPNAWVGRAIARKVRINGHLAGKVKNGSAAGFPVQPGVYRVTVGGGSSKTEEVVVTVAPNTYVNLVTTPNNTAAVFNVILGACFGVAVVLAHNSLGPLILVLVASIITSTATWAVAMARPGLFMRLKVADSGPYQPYQPYQQP